MEKVVVLIVNQFDINANYDYKKHLDKFPNIPSRTVQDVPVSVDELIELYHGDLKSLFDKYGNGLLYESEVCNGVFIDQLNEEEVKRYQEFKAKQDKIKAEQEENDRLFEEFKRTKANEIKATTVPKPSSAPNQTEPEPSK